MASPAVPPPADVAAPDDAFHLDGGDLGCARLLLLLRDRATTLEAGTVVHLTTRDPVAPIDLPVWCRLTGHEYLGPVEDHPTGPTYGVRLTGSPVPTRPDRPWHVAERDEPGADAR